MSVSEGPEYKVKLRSVDNLQRLYTFVIGLAVAQALRNLALSNGGEPGIPSLTGGLIFASLLFTLVPFYHGANRYLDACYITHEIRTERQALLIDFIILFLEGILFFVSSLYFEKPIVFIWIIVAILSIDVFWTFLTKAYTENNLPDTQNYMYWAFINIVCVLIISATILTPLIESEEGKVIYSTIVLVPRTILDYYFVWDFYYPEYFSSIKE